MNRFCFFAAFASLVGLLGACNNVGDCPATVTSGGSCSGDSLECPYTLASLSPACDGTFVDGGLQTSCVCTKGAWVCPSPVTCPVVSPTGDDGAAAGDNGAGEGGDDGGSE